MQTCIFSSLNSQSYRNTRNFSVSDWCSEFEITFLGEPGLDWGGLRREWVQLLSKRLFSPKANDDGGCGMFQQLKDDAQSLVSYVKSYDI